MLAAMRMAFSAMGALALFLAGSGVVAAEPATNVLTAASALAAAQPGDWRKPDPENLLCLDFGRVIQGMERLTALPRGSGAMGFYERAEDRIPIRSIRVAADLPEADRPKVEILRTDTPTFRQWVEARRNRREEWFHHAAGRIDGSNVPIPTR